MSAKTGALQRAASGHDARARPDFRDGSTPGMGWEQGGAPTGAGGDGMGRRGLCSPRPRNLADVEEAAWPRHHAVFAREEVDDLDADRALDRLNDTQVTRGQGPEARAVLQMWVERRCWEASCGGGCSVERLTFDPRSDIVCFATSYHRNMNTCGNFQRWK